MNQRIQELALQASLGPALLLHHWGKVDALTDSEQDGLEQIEKFAELIVRECSQAVLDVPCYYKDYRSQIEQAVINDCARAVLEKFEIKN